MTEATFRDLEKMLVKPDTKVSLKDYATKYTGSEFDKPKGHELLEESLRKLSIMQDKLYASDRYSLLIVLQAMDTAGKDGIIKHVMSGLNPAGVKVASFKVPTSKELDHDYFWRHYLQLPPRGEICIFNRSHYENVLITRVHPEFILSERLPDVLTMKDITDAFWERRYKQICRFEKNLVQNGTIIMKFFLHISKAEQKKRLLSRIDDPQKNWKFSVEDLKERGFWKDYQRAYEEAIAATSTSFAPWLIIPSDDKWYSRLAVASAMYQLFEKLNLGYPKINQQQQAMLQEAKKQLLSETD